MRILIAIAAAGVMLAGCDARVIESTIPFNPQEVAYINASGRANISGQGFMRQAGGNVVTCAGEEVSLIPLGGYARERLGAIYGSTAGGFVPILNGVSQENADPNYLSMTRKTVCDAQGNFRFDNVANGDYFVTTGVRWMVPGGYIPEGGALGRSVSIRNGVPASVILSP